MINVRGGSVAPLKAVSIKDHTIKYSPEGKNYWMVSDKKCKCILHMVYN